MVRERVVKDTRRDGNMLYCQGKELGKLIIQLAPTGIIPTKEIAPSVPVTPAEIIKATYEAYRMGVSSVHIHARDEEGKATHRRDIYEQIISGIRKTCPDIIICASTSGRIPQGNRDDVLDCAPDMASLTPGSVTSRSSVSINSFDEITRLALKMNEKGITPELEIFEAGFINSAKYLERKGILKAPLHFNLIMGSLGSIPADIRDMVHLVESLPPGSTWAAAGIGRFQVQVTAAAILAGGHVRIGLEDSIYREYREKTLTTNPELIGEVIEIARCLGREIASPREAREILSLRNPHLPGVPEKNSVKRRAPE